MRFDNTTIVSIDIAYRQIVEREWEVNRGSRRWQGAICPQHITRVVALAFRCDNGPFAGQSWNIIISRVSLIVIVDETLKPDTRVRVGRAVIAQFPRSSPRAELIQYSSANEEPVMSPALCASAEYNGLRVLRNPGAILGKVAKRTRNRGKILSALRRCWRRRRRWRRRRWRRRKGGKREGGGYWFCRSSAKAR